jgi:hypothetical protein
MIDWFYVVCELGTFWLCNATMLMIMHCFGRNGSIYLTFSSYSYGKWSNRITLHLIRAYDLHDKFQCMCSGLVLDTSISFLNIELLYVLAGL